jgi:hypothetical protein
MLSAVYSDSIFSAVPLKGTEISILHFPAVETAGYYQTSRSRGSGACSVYATRDFLEPLILNVNHKNAPNKIKPPLYFFRFLREHHAKQPPCLDGRGGCA